MEHFASKINLQYKDLFVEMIFKFHAAFLKTSTVVKNMVLYV